MSQCILNVPQCNDQNKVTYSQADDCPQLKSHSFESFNRIFATKFAEVIELWQDPKKNDLESFSKRLS